MKKILIFFLFFSVLARPSLAQSIPDYVPNRSLPDNIVLNDNQGLGVCHDIYNPAFGMGEVSWAYPIVYWRDVEPTKDNFTWQAVDAVIGRARGNGKKIWLLVSPIGPAYPAWFTTEGIRRGPGDLPVPWDDAFQNRIGHLVHQLAIRYDNDPTIEAVVVAGLGCYTEAQFACNYDEQGWLNLGYTDDIYRETIQKFVDIYLGQNYQLPDGSKITGFQKKPVVLHLGAGLYGHAGIILVNDQDGALTSYIVPKYGMRVWLKFCGLGCPQVDDSGNPVTWCLFWLNMFNDYDYSSQTRVGYETGAVYPPNDSNTNLLSSLKQHSSFTCLQKEYIQDSRYSNFYTDLAKYLGSQIIYRGSNFPGISYSDDFLSFSLRLINRGTTPLMRPKRVGIKDEVASFDVQISLAQAGQVIYSTNFTPNPPTQEWYGNQEKTINGRIFIPGTITPGSYEIFLSLVNPDLGLANYADYFKLINIELPKNDKNMYRIGSIEIRENSCSRGSLGNLDCDGQGLINGDDLTLFLNRWSPTVATSDPADLNNDSRVDEKDFSILLSNWGVPL